jgi:Pentapeptide repeats (9 copies)
VNFREAKITGVTFTDCLLRNVDFAEARLSRRVFAGCKLSGTDFSRASLDRVDLRGSELGLIVGPDPLRGAIISSGQLAAIAPVLAGALGSS